MAKKWNLQEMQETLVKDTEERIEQGFEEIKNEKGGGFVVKPVQEAPVPPVKETQGETEPTKGVQTYLPMSQYRRLNNLKLTRGENIATLAAQAITYWLDVQDNKG